MNPEDKHPWRRAILRTILGVVLLTVITASGLWTAVHLLAPEKIKGLIESSVSDYLGRKFSIDRLEIAPFPQAELRAFGVRLADTGGRVMIECPEVTARATMLSVLEMQIGVDEIRFEKPEIRLWYERNGRTNVERLIDEINARPAGPASEAPAILLHKFTVAKGRLTLSDVEGAPAVIDGLVNGHLTLKFSPLGLRGVPFDVTLDAGDAGVRAEVSGAFGAFPKLQLRAVRVPARALAPRFHMLDNCTGTADLRLEWSGGRKPVFDFSLSPAGLRGSNGALPQRIAGTVRKEKASWAVDVALTGDDTDLKTKGSVPTNNETVSFSVTGSSVSVESLSAWGAGMSAMVPPDVAPSTGPARIVRVWVSIQRAMLQGIPLTSVSFEVNRGTDSVVWVRPINFKVFSGNVDGAAEMRDHAVFVDLHGHNLELADLATDYGSEGSLRGKMSVALAGNVPVGAPVISSFTGHVEVWLEDFELQRVPGFFKVITSASFVKLIDRIKGEKSQSFLPAKGNGQAELKDGVAEVRKLWLENRVLRLGYQGRIRYAERTVDGSIVVQALTAAGQLINNLPLVRDIVLSGGKSLIPLWFRLEGPWADPKIRPMPLKSIEAPFLQIFRGLIDLPQELYDKVTGK